jgi:predicted dehydrogenase
MLEQGELDALVVATPDDLHYPITMEALDAGLHVVCEKPLASDATQARAMYEKAEAKGVKHMVLFTWRWIPQHQHVRSLIEGGYIGRGYQCSLRFLYGSGRATDYSWRFDRKRANGILGDSGSHMIDLARVYGGEIARVSAHLTTFIERPGTDGGPLDPANDAAVLTVEFVNGMQGVIQVSAVAHLADHELQQHVSLYGESGTLTAETTFMGGEAGGRITGARSDEAVFGSLSVPEDLWRGVNRKSPYFDQLLERFSRQSIGDRLFIDGIVEDHQVSPTFYDGWKVQQVIDAAIASHEQGRWITIQ